MMKGVDEGIVLGGQEHCRNLNAVKQIPSRTARIVMLAILEAALLCGVETIEIMKGRKKRDMIALRMHSLPEPSTDFSTSTQDEAPIIDAIAPEPELLGSAREIDRSIHHDRSIG